MVVFPMSSISLQHGDCLELMNNIPDKSIDMILCDLPYGTTACKWDSVIPLNEHIIIKNKIYSFNDYLQQELKKNINYIEICEQWNEKKKYGLWHYYKKIIKEDGVVVLFGQEPFSSMLRNSNIGWYRYDWIWQKEKPSNFQLMNYQPGRVQENIMIFSPKKACYTSNGNSIRYIPQMEDREKIRIANAKIYGDTTKNILHTYPNGEKNNIKIYDKKYPISIIKFNNDIHKLHPTQKPLTLCEYMIKTYSNKGDLVLDNCMGSGTTGVACKNLNRRFIGIEKEEKYFEIAKERIGI